MRAWMKAGAGVLGGVAVGGAAAMVVGARRWQRATARAVDGLAAAPPAVAGEAPARFSPDQLAGLPRPVARYFEFALVPGQPLVRRARLRWTGEFLVRAGGAWSPFTAVQHYRVHPPGFVWDADVRLLPVVPTRVRDAYVAHEGMVFGAVAGLVPVVNRRGTPEMASGALVRYLGEAVWLPTALLPGEGVRWSAIDDDTARATLADGATTVSLDVRFGARGEIVRISALRYRDANGTPVLTPWVGHLRDYVRSGGMMIPRSGEVEWVLPEGRLPYWRGRVVSADYEMGP